MVAELPEIEGVTALEFLARGGFASVYAGRRGADRVAIKLALRPGDERFAREAAALRAVGPPTCPAVYAEGNTQGGHPYLIMELVEGESMSGWIGDARRSAGRSLADAVQVFRNLCAAVQRMHEAGFVHRDLKPENAVVRGDGEITLLDFGLSLTSGDLSPRAQSNGVTRTGQRPGTATYMAPEQCRGLRTFDRRTDVYALGVILFEILTDRPPFLGDPSQVQQGHVAHRPPKPSAFNESISPEVDALVIRALAKDPAGRFADGAALVAALPSAVEAERESTPAAVAARSSRSSTGPVALLAVRSRSPIVRITEAVAREKGEVVRTAGGWYVAAFADVPSPDVGARAALRAAARLALQADRCVIHVSDLRLRRRRGTIALVGSALDEVELWANVGDLQARIALTAGAAEHVPGAFPSEVKGFFRPPSGGEQTVSSASRAEIRGRDALLAALREEALRCRVDRVPTQVTLVGDVGFGKSRVLRALADGLRSANLRVVELRAQRPEHSGGERLLRDLAGVGLGLAKGHSVEDAERAIETRLGRRDLAAAQAVAVATGALAREAIAEITQFQAPGSHRQTVASTLGAGLRGAARKGPLALLVDDAHWADPTSLDALEIATAAGDRAALLVVAAAQPQFESMRPQWGSRAARERRDVLERMEPKDARELLVELLYPAEFVPAPVLDRLLEMGDGVPLHLVELAHGLRADGAIRRLEGTDAHFVAADDLLQLGTTPLGERLANRALALLSIPLRRLAQLCAVLGDHVTVEDVEAVDRLRDSGDGGLDAGIGLATLERQGLLRRVGERSFRFRHPMARESIERMLSSSERRALHDAARQHLSNAQTPAELLRLAHHASACHEREQAARVYATLAREAEAQYRTTEAEQHYSAALRHLDDDVLLREEALIGRGRVRGRVRRYPEALSDLAEARALAAVRGADAVVADLLLQAATFHDWSWDFSSASGLVEEARPLVERVGDPQLDARFVAALGRQHFRSDEPKEAVATLTKAVDLARGLGDHQTEVEALLLLAPALVYVDQLDEGARRYDEVIDLCERTGDLLHLGAAHSNRMTMWIRRLDHEAGLADARRATELAFEVGNVQVERAARYNLAELLSWMGRLDEALPHAERSFEAEKRFFSNAGPDSALLLARVRSARGEHEQARALAADIRPAREQLAPMQRILLRAVELAAGDGGEQDWRDLICESRAQTLIDEHLEVLLSCAGTAMRGGKRDLARAALEEARKVAEVNGSAPWLARVAALESEIGIDVGG